MYDPILLNDIRSLEAFLFRGPEAVELEFEAEANFHGAPARGRTWNEDHSLSSASDAKVEIAHVFEYDEKTGEIKIRRVQERDEEAIS